MITTLVATTVILFFVLITTTTPDVVEWDPVSGVRERYADEAADEIHDAEILKAVIISMKQWANKRNHTRSKRSQNSVCYDDLGCFEDSGPFGYLEMLPSPPKEINTRFLLYSTKSRGDIPLLDVPFGNMSMAWKWADHAFSSSSPTKVIVHGFGSNCDHVWVYEMRSALMAVEECNVICVDWEAGAILPNYVRAAANTRLVGKQLSMLLEGLAENINLKYEDVHLIGFSLGAHVAGFAGSQLKNISRITGLDPAGPLFEAQDPRARLDSSDAMFVDVIHSNGENLILGGLGSWQPMGDVDFYPNGGRMQTGCSNLFVGAFTDIIWSSAIEARSLCNHRRAYKFFTDSVSPKCHFPSFPCASYDEFLTGNCFGCNGDKKCGNMGYYADKSGGRGQLYLLTRDEEPFCAHQYHVTVENSKTNRSVISYGRILLTLVGDSTLNETFPMTRKDDAELIVGGKLSRMLVPHPALGIPIKVQVEYQAYSGWISSGLNKWLIDKVLLSDSFGKMSSVCKKGLVLVSGVPIMLPLYPGNCHHSDENDNQNITNNSDEFENKIKQDTPTKTTFIPTQVVQIGDEIIKNPKLTIDSIIKENEKKASAGGVEINDRMLLKRNSHTKSHDDKNKGNVLDNTKGKPNIIPMGKHFRIESEKTADPLLSILDATDILSLPWQPLLANSLDNSQNERESGRAFGSINTRFKSINILNDAFGEASNISEIVEPILKTPATKNARSHDINNSKKEVTEPILGSAATRNIHLNSTKNNQNRTNRAQKTDSGDLNNYIMNHNESEWVPSYNIPVHNKNSDINNNTTDNVGVLLDQNSTSKDNETFSIFQWDSNPKNEEKLQDNENSSFTVQFLPSRLVSFLEKAEKYARNTLLPLVSAYTPRFLFFNDESETSIQHHYVPLEETNETHNSSLEVHQLTDAKEKIDLIKDISPPTQVKKSSERFKKSPSIDTTTHKLNINVYNKRINASVDNNRNLIDPIKIVPAPVVTSTTLASVLLDSDVDSNEKIIIVYPNNDRNDRKIQSQSYPEVLQFETLYQQTSEKSIDKEELISSPSQNELHSVSKGIYIDLPTYEPPTTRSPFFYSSTPKFIPISYSTEKDD